MSMEGSQEVFLASEDNNSTLARHQLKSNSSSSLPASFHTPELHGAARSRRPLSNSDATEWQKVQGNKSCFGSSRSLFGRSSESGFFSDSPGVSNSSLHQINELSRVGFEGHQLQCGVAEQHELDIFNENELSLLLMEFAEELGGCWKETGRYLLKKACSVENIDADYSKVSEKAYQILKKWREEKGEDSCVIDLFKCFNHIGKEDVAENVLSYLPCRIANACEMILSLSPKKIRSPSMITVIYNIKETFKELTVVKQLRMVGDDGKALFEVHLCVSKSTGKKYILKEIEVGPNSYIIAAKQAIPEKQLVIKKRKLRRTMDFLKEIRIKEETVERLKEIVEQLQSKLENDYFSFCKEDLNCTNCEKTKMKLELLEKELSLLHHTLGKMSSGDRRLSVTGIPTERISELADRTYGVCEDHKKMHSEITKIRRRCSVELLDVETEQLEDEENSEDDNLTECTLNIIQHFTRKRNVVQSLTPKRRKESKAVQRNKSDRSASRSRFYVPIRQSFMHRRGNKAQATPNGLTRNNSKRTKKSAKSKDSKVITRTKSCSEKSADPQSFLPRTNTSPDPLVRKMGVVGPEDLDLDDLDDVDCLSSRVKGIKIGGQPHQPLRVPTALTSTHKKIHKCNSDPYVRNVKATESRNTMNQERDSHGEGVLDIVTQEFYSERGRSHSDGQPQKYSRDQIAKKRKSSQKRDPLLRKNESDVTGVSQNNKPSQKRDMYNSSKSNTNFFEVPSSHKSTPKRSQLSRKNESGVTEVSQNHKPSQKRDKPDKSHSNLLEVSASDKSIQKRDQIKNQSAPRMPSSDLRSVTGEINNPEEVKSDENVKWLKDVDTENTIFV